MVTSDELLTNKADALRDLVAGIDPERCPEPLDYVQVLRMIEQTAKSALAHAVVQAHASGATWAQIGTYLGVSAQAAHERFASRS